MKTIVFDMMGLVAAYPNFDELVAKPLAQSQKARIGLWTKDSRDNYFLREWSNFFLGKEDIEDFGLAVEANGQGFLDGTYARVGIFENRLPLPAFREEWSRWEKEGGLVPRGKEWSARFKNPRILGDKRCLLVESDLGEFNKRSKTIERSPLTDAKLKFAEKLGFALIMVPEYPDVWKGRNCPVEPDEVLIYLRNKLLRWRGDDIQEDIGKEMGIYGGNSSPALERR